MFPLRHSSSGWRRISYLHTIIIILIYMKRKIYLPPQTAVKELAVCTTVLTASRESSYLDPKELELSEMIWD